VTAQLTQVSETPTVAARVLPSSPLTAIPPPLDVPGVLVPLGDLPVLPGIFALQRRIQQHKDSKAQQAQSGFSSVCVALCGKGMVRIKGNGQIKLVNLSTEMTAKLSVIPENAQDRIEYVALGEHGQYYVRKMNGKAIYSGGKEFNMAMSACLTSGVRP